MNFEEFAEELDSGKVFKAHGKIREEGKKEVYVEWYVYRVQDLYVAVNSENSQQDISDEKDVRLLVEEANYPEKEIVDLEDIDYSEEDFQQIFEEETCSCEEPVPFRPKNSPWSCGFCGNILKDQDIEGDADE